MEVEPQLIACFEVRTEAGVESEGAGWPACCIDRATVLGGGRRSRYCVGSSEVTEASLAVNTSVSFMV